MNDQDDIKRMSNDQLLEAIIGTKQVYSVIKAYPGLKELGQATIDELCNINHLGQKKALAICSAFELARRMKQEIATEKPLLDTPEKVADLLKEECLQYKVEHFLVLMLNVRKRLIRVEKIAIGTLDSVLVSALEVFKPAIYRSCYSVILVHNHPSGCVSPSEADIKVTRDLIRAGKLLKIQVLDHIIIGSPTDKHPEGFLSLRAQGYFYD